MRKQTKLVAVLSTAALLAVGASMSSFAATGWQEENGTWVYYDKSGELETEKWEKSGDYWFYLNEDGEMATDAIVEYNDNYYYVDENGAMSVNRWVSVENEDYGDDDDEPVNHWYYFGSNGKAYKSSSSSSNASFKTINGKKYLFDDEGKMLFGWIGTDGERKTGDTAWQEGDYYCGDENDGAQAIGWAYLDIVDDNYDSNDYPGYSSGNVFDDENQTRWFYFKGNGKKMVNEKGKTINGRKYSFDEYGRMNAEWVIYGATPTQYTTATGSITATQGSADYTRNWRYYGSPEDGARVTKGWFKVVPDENLHEKKYNDDEDAWYYADKDGKLLASEMKTINGKKYLFDEFGRMKSGLKFVKFDGKGTSKVASILDDDDDDYPFDTEDSFKQNANVLLTDNYYCYYFGNGEDGSMKTNKQNVDVDGESFSFLFNKSGSYKGAGKTGVDSSKYYLAGMLLKADKDDKYAVIQITTDKDGVETYDLLTTDQFLECGYVSEPGIPEDKDWSEFHKVDNERAKREGVEFKLVNTSGSVQKNKTKAKDGNDLCYHQKNSTIEYVYAED